VLKNDSDSLKATASISGLVTVKSETAIDVKLEDIKPNLKIEDEKLATMVIFVFGHSTQTHV
jgi:hypothetical protein